MAVNLSASYRLTTTSPFVAAPSAVSPWDLRRPAAVPVARPRLAPVQAALPYLSMIDEGRIYSNFGPLNTLFEQRLAARHGLPAECVSTCANATVGLALSLASLARPGGVLCMMPSWTFAATGHAAVAAGFTPFLVDVDPETGALTPEIALEALRAAPAAVAAVMPVAPFGLALSASAWDAFSASTGVPVIVDAAAGFDALVPGEAPSVVSLHATKVLGIGEGGYLVSRAPAHAAAVRQRSNFGFAGDRNAALPATNGKISEYAAAIGLAALDLWPILRAEQMSVLNYYRAALADEPGVRIAPGLGETWSCTTFNVELSERAALAVESGLAERGIATRRWWGGGLHRHDAFAKAPQLPTPVGDRLAAGTVGLPCWPGLEPGTIDEIVAAMRPALRG